MVGKKSAGVERWAQGQTGSGAGGPRTSRRSDSIESGTDMRWDRQMGWGKRHGREKHRREGSLRAVCPVS